MRFLNLVSKIKRLVKSVYTSNLEELLVAQKEVISLGYDKIERDREITSLKYSEEINKRKYDELNLKYKSLQESYQESLEKLRKYKIKEEVNKITSVKQLEELNECNIVEREEVKGEYILYRGICSLGGCDKDPILFKSYIEALRYGAVMKLSGIKVDTRCACSDCYSEYMRDCI